MQKVTKYDWKESNLAHFGSDAEKQVKKGSAECEEAWKAVTGSKEARLFVWRIEKFLVKEWPEEDYGKFYSGDSYVVLNSYKAVDSDALLHDIHFWIGKESTQDEYGTAAYKTVELDCLLDDLPIQHREVQGHESELFKSYFPVITILKGGCSSGFRHVPETEYRPRLFVFHGQSRIGRIEVIEIPLARSAITSDDVYVLDLGRKAFQFNGKLSNKNERLNAAQYLQQLESERNGKCQTEVIDEDDETATAFFTNIPDVPYTRKEQTRDQAVTKKLLRLSDASGSIQTTLISEGTIPRSMLESHDVYIIDTTKECFVYIGADSSKEERCNAFAYAHEYLKHSIHPFIPVTVITAKQKSDSLDKELD